MKWWQIANSKDLADDSALGFKVGDAEWPVKGLVVRQRGVVYAWVNSCPHAGHALNYGPDDFMTPDGRYVRCSSHGARFEPDSGLCVFGPCPGQSLQSLKCTEENGVISVLAPESQRQL